VTIGKNVVIRARVRVCESNVVDGAVIQVQWATSLFDFDLS